MTHKVNSSFEPEEAELTIKTSTYEEIVPESSSKKNESSKKGNKLDKLYKKINRLESFANIMFYINLIVSAITIFEFEYQNLFFKINIVTSVSYIIITNLVDIYLKNKADNKRRKGLLKHSFNVDITPENTQNYYNSKEKESIRKFGIDCFENVFFTKTILSKMMTVESIKVFFILVLYIILLIQIKNLELLVLITQTVFSSEYLFKYVKFCYYKIHSTRIYSKFYDMFITSPQKEESVLTAKILDAAIDYECLKFYCKISLSSRVYKKYNDKLNRDWEGYSQKIESNKHQ